MARSTSTWAWSHPGHNTILYSSRPDANAADTTLRFDFLAGAADTETRMAADALVQQHREGRR